MARRPTHRPRRVLLVEDNPGDAGLTKVALQETGEDIALDIVVDGEEAMDYLHRRGAYQDAPRPDVVLLDLNLPRKDGREVLAEIKQDPDLRRIPVGILSSSSAQDDVAICYDRHANWYMTKPVGLTEFIEAMGRLVDHWFHKATLSPA